MWQPYNRSEISALKEQFDRAARVIEGMYLRSGSELRTVEQAIVMEADSERRHRRMFRGVGRYNVSIETAARWLAIHHFSRALIARCEYLASLRLGDAVEPVELDARDTCGVRASVLLARLAGSAYADNLADPRGIGRMDHVDRPESAYQLAAGVDWQALASFDYARVAR